jgi:ribose transport system permease protein
MKTQPENNGSKGSMEIFTKFKNTFNSTETGILLVLISLAIILSIITPNFAGAYNLGVLVRQFSFVTLLAMGQTLVLLTRGIDLSVGAIAGLCGILSAWFMQVAGFDPYISVILGIIIGACCGAINGLFITKLNLNPFIVTLAMGEIFAGFIYVITEGWPITEIPKSILFLGQGMIGPIPVPAIIMVVLAIIFIYILHSTPFGRHIYAIGGNENAANLVGIRIDKTKIMVYALSGVFAASGGILMMLRLGAGQPQIGEGWLMPSITAAIIGGTSLMGGQGKIIGTVFGAALMGVLANAIVLLGVSAYWEKVVIGAVVLIAITFDRLRSGMNRL